MTPLGSNIGPNAPNQRWHLEPLTLLLLVFIWITNRPDDPGQNIFFLIGI